MLAIHPNSFGPNHSTMTIGAVAMLPVPESVSILRLLFVSGTLRYAAVTALSSRNPRWIGSCGPPGRFRDRWLQDELSDLEANQENNGICNPTVAHHKHEHPGSSAGMFAHVFQWIPAELQENYFAEILLQLHTYACDGTLSSGTLLGFQFETSEGFDHIDSPALWKTFGTSALRNIIVMLSGMKENRSSPWSDTRVSLSLFIAGMGAL